jgi:hypothetical protein
MSPNKDTCAVSANSWIIHNRNLQDATWNTLQHFRYLGVHVLFSVTPT